MVLVNVLGFGFLFMVCQSVCEFGLKNSPLGIQLKTNGDIQSAATKLTGSIHNFIQIPLALKCLLHNDLGMLDRLSDTTNLSTLILYISTGYFLFDMIICIRHFDREGVKYLVHACACFFSYFILPCHLKLLHFYAVRFILWELSSPFLHLRWFLYKLNASPKLKLLNDLFLFIAFFSCRIVWGVVISLEMWTDVCNIMHLYNPYITYSVFIFTTILNSLNFIWFSMMIRKFHMYMTK